MDGIERIAARIREDAEQEIARMNQEATEQVEAIQAGAGRDSCAGAPCGR